MYAGRVARGSYLASVDSRQTAYAATAVDPQTQIRTTLMIEQTALARLLQERREAAGYSRAKLGKTLGISPGTIEGWELGRIGKPPFHEVMRIASFLRIAFEDLQRAVFADSGTVPDAEELPAARERKRPGRK